MKKLNLVLVAAMAACVEPSPVTTSPGLNQPLSSARPGTQSARDLGRLEIDIPAPADWPAHFTDDAALIEAIRAADGGALIGFKEPSVASKLTERPRTIRNGAYRVILPAISRETIEAGRSLVAKYGTIGLAFTRIRAVSATIDPERAPELRAHPLIDYVQPNGLLWSAASTRAPSPNLAPRRRAQTTPDHVLQVRANQAWSQTKGGSTLHWIDVLDTGVDDGEDNIHEDLGDPILCWSTLEETGECDDEDGHGTGVTGVAAALDNTTDLVGVAPEADYRAIKWRVSTSGHADTLIAAIEMASSHYFKQIIVITAQACADYTPLSEAVGDAYDVGDLVIAAAGNSDACTGDLDDDEVAWPARYSDVIAVSGVDPDDDFAEPGIPIPGTSETCSAGSRYGSEVELAGPFLTLTLALNDGVVYQCGTSFAAPSVAGAAALLWSVAPSWTNAQVRSRLQSTAKDVEASGWDNETGYGLVDACKVAGMCPALTASISGIDSIPPFTSCTYDANVYGGIPGYTYQWSGLASGTGSSVTVNTSSSGWLYLTAKDASTPQQTKNAQKYISVVQAPPGCF